MKQKELSVPPQVMYVVFDKATRFHVGAWDSRKRAQAELNAYLYRVYDVHGERPTCYNNEPDVKHEVDIVRYILDPQAQ